MTHSSPQGWADGNRNGTRRRHAHKAAVVLNAPMSKQSGQESKSLCRQQLIDEGLLPFQCLERTTARLSIVIRLWIHDLREQFSRRSETVRGTAIAAVQWLAKHELTAVGRVAKIEPLSEQFYAYV